jgi:hypothetical protein
MRFLGRLGVRLGRRSRWLAERLWLIAAIEVGWIANRHWRRLDRDERRRLRQLLLKSRGRPSRLSASERRQADTLLRTLDYAELGGSVAAVLLPFRPLARLVEAGLGRVGR